MNWKEVTVEINSEAAEAVSYIMNEYGCGGVVVTDTIDNRIKIIAYYYDDEDFPVIINEVKQRINKLLNYNIDTGKVLISIENTHYEDWATSWHKYFRPLEIGKKFIISPSWEDSINSDRRLIKIDPGMAFGIGSHETTRMCIELLEKFLPVNGDIVNVNEDIDTMLDIGTGTGILAIAAAYLGISDIIGVDIDPAAVSAARENISINKVEDRIRIIKGDMTKDISGIFSIITANLLPDLIMCLLPSIPPLMNDQSKLILSGITRDKRDMIFELFSQLRLKLIDEKEMNEWVSLAAVKE